MNSREAILRDRYEVIVVGTGIGGLSTAAVLAHEGLEVLVIEQAHQPGGCCSSFRVGDFTFDAAASTLQGFGELGFHVQRTLFDFLNQQVELVARDTAYCMYFGEHKIEFFLDLHAFQVELGATFPQQAGSIISFMRELGHLHHAVLECSGPLKPVTDESRLHRWSMHAGHPVSAFILSHYQRRSAGRVFRRHISEPLVKSFFNADLVYNTGYDIDELSAPSAALAIMDRHTGGTHYPLGSTQQIPDRLEKSVIEHGGRVLYRTPVEEVTVEDGKATGVLLADGTTISAEAVIWNGQAGDLFSRLVRPEHLKPETLEWASSLEPTRGVLAVYLGVKEDIIPEDFCVETVLIEDPEMDPGRSISIRIPSLSDPNLSPEGCHTVCVQAVTDPGIWPSSRDPSYEAAEYNELKESEGARVVEKVESLLPGLREAVVEKRVASPATFERYTGRGLGSLGGPRLGGELVPSNLPGAVTEVRGLLLAGDSTFYGRGVAAAAASGINAALATVRYLGLRSPRFHPARESFVLETVPVRPQISASDVVDTISAVLESHRCMRCEDAPCRTGCPAGVDIPNFIRRAVATDFLGAARLVRESTPLGEVCGLMCPVDRLCESRCRRGGIDSAVRIGQLEALVCSFAEGPGGWLEPFRGERKEKVAVIGSGPAGISCAYYLSILGYNVEIFEAGVEAGGQPARAIPDTRISQQVLSREIEGAMRSGIEFRGNTTFGVDIDFESLWRDGFRAVFLGAGLTGMRMPEVSGSELPGVIDALSFLVAARRGVKRELSPTVAVLGHSNLALDSALLALDIGAEKVLLVTDRPEGGLTSTTGSVKAARERGVEFITNTVVDEIAGEGRVEGIKLRPAVESAGRDDRPGRSRKVETVIIAGEQEVDRPLFDYIDSHLRMNPEGTVEVDPGTLMTSRPGVFAGGDLVSGGGLVVSACAQGRLAALSIDRYLRSVSGLTGQAGDGEAS